MRSEPPVAGVDIKLVAAEYTHQSRVISEIGAVDPLQDGSLGLMPVEGNQLMKM